MKYGFILLFGLLSFQIKAQKFEITRKILDKGAEKPLEAATSYVEKPTDCILVSYTISEKDGDFNITGNSSVPKPV